MGSDRNRSGICSGYVYDKFGSRDRIYCSGSDHYNCTGILSESKMQKMTVSLVKMTTIEKKYSKAERAVFIDRPHRFILHVRKRTELICCMEGFVETWENKGNKENVKKNCHTITSMVQYK